MRDMMIAALLVVAIFPIPLSAQDASQMIQLFGGMVRSMADQSMQREWATVSPGETVCIDSELRRQGRSLQEFAGRPPSSPEIVKLRRGCQENRNSGAGPATQESTKYAVNGIVLGGRLPPSLDAEYRCGASTQFPALSWCENHKTEVKSGGMIALSGSLLRSSDGATVYISRHVEPARFAPREVDQEIQRLSAKFGEKASILKSPEDQTDTVAMIASWGQIKLEPLDPQSIADLAAGRPIAKGMMIDFAGDFRKSAQSHLPVFRLTGGPGFLWAARYDSSGRGYLRYLAANLPSDAPAVLGAESTHLANAASRTQPDLAPMRAPSSAVPPSPSPREAMDLRSVPYEVTGTKAVVTVKGYGSDPAEARKDAIRAALQRTMQQLIVVDKMIKDDQVVRDKIMSTMNGYVENYKEVRTSAESGTVVVEAEVTVSPSRITNFLGTEASGSASSVDGGSLLAESEREIGQRKARGELFDRLFRGFPSDVLHARLLNIAPSDQDPNIFAVDVEISYSQQWVTSLISGLQSLSVGTTFGLQDAVARVCAAGAPNCWSSLQSNAATIVNSQSGTTYRSRTEPRPQIRYACVSARVQQRCFILPPGDYAASIKYPIDQPLVYLAVRFVDDAGRSAHINAQPCILLPAGSNGLSVKFDRQDGQYLLDTAPVNFRLSIKADALDAGRAKKAILFPFFVESQQNTLLSGRRFSNSAFPISQSVVTDVFEPAISNVCGDTLDQVAAKLMSSK